MRFKLIDLKFSGTNPFKHVCKGTPVAIRVMHVQEYNSPFGQRPAHAETFVLKRCKCGQSAVETLIGDWTQEEILGQTPPLPDGDKILDALMRKQEKP